MKNKPKILFILNIPPPIHGSSVVGKNIKDSKIINQDFNCQYVNLSTSVSVNEIGVASFGKLIRYFRIILKTIYSLIAFRPSLCYLSITVSKGGLYKDFPIILISKLLCSKVVYHLHNKGVKDNQENWLNNYLYKVIFRKSSVILLSQNLYNDIENYVLKENIFVCPNGIPDIVQIQKSKEQKSKVQILFLSNLLNSKGIFVLLEAMRELKNNSIPFEGIVVGGEGDISANEFQQKVELLSLQDTVRYFGKKIGEEKDKIIGISDIFVLPTLNETFGLVNLEAMQQSLPVISTKEGGIPDVVEDGITGFLVDKNNPIQLAQKLEILIKDKILREKMGVAGRLKYEKEFTLEVFEKNMEAILKKILFK